MSALRVVLAIVALWIGLVWHQSILGRMGLFGQRFDFVIVVIVLVGIRTRPGWGAFFGFVAGSCQGGAAGANMTALAATRTLLGFAAGFVSRSGLQVTPPIVGLVTLVLTLVAQGLLLFLAPPPDIGRFLGATLGTAIYNGVLAGLTDTLLRRTIDPRVD